MNFFAHSFIAADRAEHPRFLLGSMLPDLTGMLGARIAELPDSEVRAGVAHHHATDAAFHGSPCFARLCAEAIHTLTTRGLERGSARAVGHVGIELLLDGTLSHDKDARRRYTEALAQANQTPLDQLVVLRNADHHEVLRRGITRLIAAPVPQGYRDPEFVVARLHHMLAPRPRLALREGDLAAVHDWVRSAKAELVSSGPQLLAEVRAALRAAQP